MAEKVKKGGGKQNSKSDNSEYNDRLRIIARFRPVTSKEVADGEGKPCQCVTFGDCGKSTTIRVDGDNEHAFTFDAVKGPDTRQADIYAEAAHSIVERVLQGYHGSVMTYGQSGTGKTHTMEGDLTTTGDASGLIGRSAHHLFSEMQPEVEAGTAVVKVSYVEIYKEKVRCLLDPHAGTDLEVRPDPAGGMCAVGAAQVQVASEDELMEVVLKGSRARCVVATSGTHSPAPQSSTGLNSRSSRSHAVLIITVDRYAVSSAAHVGRHGKLLLVDLSGSETLSKSGAEGTQLEEAKMINKSLSTLGLVIMALSERKASHVPYRDSRLTRLLQDSLGGGAQTCLVLTCSPSLCNAAETINTLRFGARAQRVQNHVVLRGSRTGGSDATARMEQQIAALQAQLGALLSERDALQLDTSRLRAALDDLSAPKCDPQTASPVGKGKDDGKGGDSEAAQDTGLLVKLLDRAAAAGPTVLAATAVVSWVVTECMCL